MPSNSTSSTTTSGRKVCATRWASVTSPSLRTSKPSGVRLAEMISRICGSSSTIKTRCCSVIPQPPFLRLQKPDPTPRPSRLHRVREPLMGANRSGELPVDLGEEGLHQADRRLGVVAGGQVAGVGDGAQATVGDDLGDLLGALIGEHVALAAPEHEDRAL